MLACWIAGMLAYWITQLNWHAGLLACWSPGMLASWHAGLLACWPPGMLAYWHAGKPEVGKSITPSAGTLPVFQPPLVTAFLT